jgi:hypothetical protein
MKKFWNVRSWIETIITMLVIYSFVWFTFTNIDKGKVQAQESGYQNGLGHAMKYVDVPVSEGEYKVIAVIDKWKGTAVIKKLPHYSEETEPLLVTDMMPNMMEVGYIFRKGGSGKE